MPSNINNLEQTIGSLQARIDELEAMSFGGIETGSYGDSGSDESHWSGEVFFNGRRFYDATLWDDGTFGDDTTGMAIANAANAFVKISLDPDTAAASIVSYQAALPTAETTAIEYPGALWHNIRTLSGPIHVNVPNVSFDGADVASQQINYAPFQGYLKEDGSVTVNGGRYYVGGVAVVKAASDNSAASKYAVLSVGLSHDPAVSSITWESALVASDTEVVRIPLGYYGAQKTWTQYVTGVINIPSYNFSYIGGTDADSRVMVTEATSSFNIAGRSPSGIGSIKDRLSKTALVSTGAPDSPDPPTSDTVAGVIQHTTIVAADPAGTPMSQLWVWGAGEPTS
jgi:hypothetical protein